VPWQSVSALCFSPPPPRHPSVGRLTQGAGGDSPRWRCLYRREDFPASRAATLIGATPDVGMAVLCGSIRGGARHCLGCVVEEPLDLHGLLRYRAQSRVVHSTAASPGSPAQPQLESEAVSVVTVFRNPQTILCGNNCGPLFVPTTVFDMIWGVRYLQEAHGLEYGDA